MKALAFHISDECPIVMSCSIENANPPRSRRPKPLRTEDFAQSKSGTRKTNLRRGERGFHPQAVHGSSSLRRAKNSLERSAHPCPGSCGLWLKRCLGKFALSCSLGREVVLAFHGRADSSGQTVRAAIIVGSVAAQPGTCSAIDDVKFKLEERPGRVCMPGRSAFDGLTSPQ